MTKDIERRTIIKGAAWSVPAVALAVAAPAAAASGPRQTYTFTATGNGNDKSTCTFTLPPTATNITYTVLGASGGGLAQVAGEVGGTAFGTSRGEQTTGSLVAASTAQVITLVGAGRGGNAPLIQNDSGWTGTSTPIPGGKGWADGGTGGVITIPSASHDAPQMGAGGGGASAIAIGSTPIVIAAGAGGLGPYGPGQGGAGSNTPQGPGPEAGTGGAAPSGNAVSTTTTFIMNSGPARTVSSTGGQGASGATGGAGAAVSTTSSDLTFNTVAGNAGQSAAAGGRGADGVSGYIDNNNGVSRFASGSGGGGGGYAGGGSGSVHSSRPNGDPLSAHSGGSGGGAGSGYTAPSFVSGVQALSTGSSTRTTGGVGSATVTFEAPVGSYGLTC